MRPPCLRRTLTLVPTASLLRIVLKKPLFRGHPSTPYYGHILVPNNAYQYKMTSCYGQLHPHFKLALYREPRGLYPSQLKNAMSTKKKARNALTLKKKYELIDLAKKNPHLSSRALAALS